MTAPQTLPIEEVTLSGEDQEVLLELGTVAVWQRLASYPRLTEESQARLSRSKDPLVREGLAANPSLLPRFQKKFLTSDANTRRWLASNPNLTVRAQRSLAVDGNHDVRRMLSLNPNLDHGVQVTLTLDTDKSTRSRLQSNLTAQLTSRMGAKFLQEYHPTWFDHKSRNTNPTTLATVVETWEGSLRDLLRAADAAPDRAKRLNRRGARLRAWLKR